MDKFMSRLKGKAVGKSMGKFMSKLKGQAVGKHIGQAHEAVAHQG